ncbi:hypothetical protein [Puniceibacterium sp. IMCC21224]|uniref:hypothetical protein n=1 Tax=Puniceibacterium sp. IMCC21224 TaxID=1618204 RepID=UPI00064E0DD0|nr:hypothetical protein [Puniceibacterium sp. IMCC21224]KMK68800.1 hypothetical protein IMCC21224_113686 [Puniceibacterium sp. IMCC21224]
MRNFRRVSVLLVLEFGACFYAASGQAAVYSDAIVAQKSAGVPVNQRFLDSGASIVATADAKSCVVSRRVEIENSSYLTSGGDSVPFDEIVRSPATSIQAVAGADGAISFRIQLKYSLVPQTPVSLMIGDTIVDVRDALERSTDSLWLVGQTATDLETAFRDGVDVRLAATSVDTNHQVQDSILAPDFPALTDCVADLATDELPEGRISNDVRLMFHADPATTPLATLPELRACRMKDEPGELYLAKLDEVGGFFSQTNEIFVSFGENGTLARAYIPGIFDGNFSGYSETARLSRAADANVPDAPNDVKGCLGSAEISICTISSEDGNHVLAPCNYMQMLSLTTGDTDDDPTSPTVFTPTFVGGTPGQPPRVFGNTPVQTASSSPPGTTNFSPVTGGGSSNNGSPPDSGTPFFYPPTGGGGGTSDPGAPIAPAPPTVPLPASLYFIGAALLSLFGARRLRRNRANA